MEFRKYHGAGNDFVLIDNRKRKVALDENLLLQLCNRKYGVGADGILEINESLRAGFKLTYFNSNGREGSLCGNGSRCAISYFIESSQTCSKDVKFECMDMIHSGGCIESNFYLYMRDISVKDIIRYDDDNYYINTGSPHHVRFVNDMDDKGIESQGYHMCYGQYGSDGCNINFCKHLGNSVVKARTFERGVDTETLACGTGATAIAIIYHFRNKTPISDTPNERFTVDIQMPGGILTVKFTAAKELISNITLVGPAVEVFRGIYPIDF